MRVFDSSKYKPELVMDFSNTPISQVEVFVVPRTPFGRLLWRFIRKGAVNLKWEVYK